MKKSVVWMILAGALLGAMIAQAGTVWPNLVGVWKGNLNTATSAEGYGILKSKLVVVDQSVALFRGYLTIEGSSETNWVVGSIQTSLVAPGSYDITVSMKSDESSAIGAWSAILVTTSVPWKMTRLQVTGFDHDTGSAGNFIAQGTLTKK